MDGVNESTAPRLMRSEAGTREEFTFERARANCCNDQQPKEG